MNKTFRNRLIGLAALCHLSTLTYADAKDDCMDDWIEKSDAEFAADCADMAFEGDLKQRQTVAWMFFVRTNQLIKDSQKVSESGRVPQWMAWATDSDTFTENPSFKYTETNRDDITPVTEKKVLSGSVSMDEPNGGNEEVTRNEISYNYLTNTAKLNTKQGVLDYVRAGNRVDMPVGSLEIKASWMKVPAEGAPEGALTYTFDSGTYWWRGIHIMVKMRPLPKENLFYSEEPSWFWTTFEFTNNIGVAHVRKLFITQDAPLSNEDVASLLKAGGIAGAGFEAYSPNGTQIRFTEDGKGVTPVILGHTDMEDFAGSPNPEMPQDWTSFNSSCHTCHATAAINPTTEAYFPFSVPIGKLTPNYHVHANGESQVPFLGEGFVPLDFMWPIPFHAK